ncbi:MAG: DNA-deoxyinosine glycosylase [Lachnospiraceae bacterium]|nr:DNA-deoxyinosine glycosylase [Lachnospiraceae bacterium]
MAEYSHIRHTFKPIFDHNSKILILGSLPSVKSREQGFYYGNPRNRFWLVISEILKCDEPKTIEEKKEMLLWGQIAIWDVISECDIKGSSDSSIRNVIPADIGYLLKQTNIRHIFANGNTAGRLYRKYVQDKTGQEIIILPSTSPANAAYSLQRLVSEWKAILDG